jgi:MFS family permease
MKNITIFLNKIFPIFCVYMCESLNLYILYTFLPLLLHHFNISNTNQYRSLIGLYSSLYFLAQFICNYPLCKLSDKIGRKIPIICGLCASLILNIFMGLCINFWLSLLIRFCQGLFDGNAGLSKCYINDISPKDEQVKYYSVLIVAWSVGSLLAFIIGGYGYNNNSSYPAFIPYMCISFIIFSVLLFEYFYLQESDKFKIDLCIKDEIIIEHVVEEKENNDDNKQIIVSIIVDNNKILDEEKNNKRYISIYIYILIAIIDIAITETMILWYTTSKSEGGLELSQTKIGILLVVSNIIGLSYLPILLLYEKSINKTFTLKILILLLDILIIFIPFIKNFIYLCIFTSIRTIVINFIFNLIYVLISSSNTSNNGKINGLAQSLSSLTKIIIPVLSTYFYNWSIIKNTEYINSHLLSYILVFISFFALLIAEKL